MKKLDITIIGVGRLGGALAIALSQKGFEINNLVVRRSQTAQDITKFIKNSPQVKTLEEINEVQTDVVFICATDSALESITEFLSSRIENKPTVFHTSGAISSRILQPLSSIGCKTASFHPLISLSDPVRGSEKFKNSYFCLEGEQEAVDCGEQIVRTLGGIPFTINSAYKTLYHAAAVTACGHVVALIAESIEMLVKCGLGKDEAKKVLLPLIFSTMENLSQQSPAEALTGPFARGDRETVKAHLQTIQDNLPAEILEIYRLLGITSLKLAQQKGVDINSLKDLEKILNFRKT